MPRDELTSSTAFIQPVFCCQPQPLSTKLNKAKAGLEMLALECQHGPDPPSLHSKMMKSHAMARRAWALSFVLGEILAATPLACIR